ncbi:MAG: hypothetical protein SOV85_09995 [Clostridium sp.]|uniref:hypothetical protein n=1 Tax=Clostridium sp. TaxID=1506 RepID=UPI0025B86EB6|nr:hypothetical protein [Clostridium sp.]MDY2631663.1 hypothetical protein [Clostridium sp.]
MKKMNNYICCGLLLNAIWILSIRYNLLPDFIEGAIVGLGLLFVLIGMCFEKYAISKIKNYKKNLFSRITTK